MRVKYSDSIQFKVLAQLKRVRGDVILRKDLENLGSYRQVSRVLKNLIEQKQLIKIGLGIYAKSYPSQTYGIPIVQCGVENACRQALDRLGVKYLPGTAQMAYNSGKSTQVPVKDIIKLKSRCRRQLGYKSNQLYYENNINAK